VILSDAFDQILKTIANCLGIPACNANTQHRLQGDGKLQIASRDGGIVAISANNPKSGYLRWVSTPTSSYFRGCSTNKYAANFTAVIWEQGGDVANLQSVLWYWLTQCNTDALPYSLIDITIKESYTTYEQIMSEEHGQIPTQAGLAVAKIDFEISFVSSDCEIDLPECFKPIFKPVPPQPPFIPAAVKLFFDNTGIDSTLQTIMLAYYNKIRFRTYFAKLAAIYPFVGGNANAHKFNFLDARDLNSAFRLQFFGGWVHSATGILANTTNTWANTFWSEQANATPNSWNFGFYSRTDSTASSTRIDMGSTNATISSNVNPRSTSNRLFLRHGSSTTPFVSGAVSTLGLYQVNRTNIADIRARVNSITLTLTSAYLGQTSIPYAIGALNTNNVLSGFTGRAYGYAFIANVGFTDIELIDFENDVLELMTALGRAV